MIYNIFHVDNCIYTYLQSKQQCSKSTTLQKYTLATLNLILISAFLSLVLNIRSRSKVIVEAVNITLPSCNRTGIVPGNKEEIYFIYIDAIQFDIPYTNSIKNALKSMTLVPVANKTPVEHELLTLLENLSSTHILDDVCVVHLKIFVFVFVSIFIFWPSVCHSILIYDLFYNALIIWNLH